ncbi:helix-turn-helix domain-containing protein [Gordonia rhizosphera]|uniref:Putative MmyB family DNA-binding protein n=1 Tax=Gordonia rhizosphera NBRC 16068 TaxID=1108045 RepID=K6W3F8_9ACTN|nr:helix-turn-helix domain-containing protein [Gordonia rhizosphera]GAB93695.1 putative MmyB family DNA-binding protein [Gordonia rhizosphera NBRC 16068]
MDLTHEIRDFLMTRRARIRPEDVGLVAHGKRRVPGLRREELAQLANVSVDYYTQIERGQVAGASDEILGAIAEALQLDADETRHFFILVRAARSRSARPTWARDAPQVVPDTVRAMLRSLETLPALVQTQRLDVIDANQLGRALYADAADPDGGTLNLARFIFLDDRAPRLLVHWESSADDAVGILRVAAARAPDSPRITDLIDELSTRSDDFRTRWARHDVVGTTHGTMTFNHSALGRFALNYEALSIPRARGVYVVVYSAGPETRDADALKLLSAWAATNSETPHPTGGESRIG